MKILITGIAGFIGSHVARHYIGAGYEVIGVDSFDPYYSPEWKRTTAQELEELGAQVIEYDLTAGSLPEQCKDAQLVLHAAAQPGNSSAISFERYLKNNLLATQILVAELEESEALQAFINISTSSVYGLHATQSETIPPAPISNYGVTKLAAEQYVLSRQRDKSFPACSLRLYSVYGERERPDKLLPLLSRRILAGEPFPLFDGSLSHERSFTYVGDIVKGIALAFENWSEAEGEIFNIGNDSSITTGQAIEIVESLLGKKALFEKLPARPGDQISTLARIEKAREKLGYDPKVLPEEGIKRVTDWVQTLS